MSILVLGDLIIDEYLKGDSVRLSPESPIPVITNLTTEVRAGGAANVALNIQAMGSRVKLISQAGEDLDPKLLSKLKTKILHAKTTPKKTRVLANNHAICRLDVEQYQEVTPSEKWITDKLTICVLSDYNKGFLHNSIQIINWCKSRGIDVIVDPKKSWDNYRGCWLLKANYKELCDQVSVEVKDDDLANTCASLSKLYNIENFVITLGSRGLFVWSNDQYELIPTRFNRVVDVTGAGDVVIAALAHYTNVGLSLITAAKRANRLAESSVSHLGCYVVNQEDLLHAEEKVVFTNGCFDILHRGHIEYLRTSKSYGTRLVVGLNSDRSVRELKGPTRPIHNEHDRKALLESLEFVDEVIIFDEPTPRELILRIKPDIITKGGDYTVDTVVGHDLVNQVIIVPLVDTYSTSNIIKKINQ